MKTPTLVVSNPPHGKLDRRAAARCFELTPAEALMKANFRAPEIWMADTDAALMEEAARRLGESGLNTKILDGAVLLDVPAHTVATGFELTDQGAVLHANGDSQTLGAGDRMIGVFCKPPADTTPAVRTTRSLADGLGRRQSVVFVEGLIGAHHHEDSEVIERSTFLDLYLLRDEGDLRFSLAEDLLDFSGLGRLRKPESKDNMLILVDELDRRFDKLQVDRRLENLRPRLRPMVKRPTMHDDDRKLFSYGTEALSHLLESISPDLKNLAQYELGSRLSFLMSRGDV